MKRRDKAIASLAGVLLAGIFLTAPGRLDATSLDALVRAYPDQLAGHDDTELLAD